MTASVDQALSFAFHGDAWRRRHVEAGLRDQGRDLRPRLPALLGPAGAFAKIDVDSVRLWPELRPGLLEQRRFLGAADQ